MAGDQLAQQAIVNSMSLIEMQCLRDKAIVRTKEIERKRKLDAMHKEKMELYARNINTFAAKSEYFQSQYVASEDGDENLTVRERHARMRQRAMEREAERERKSALTYR